MQGWLPRLFHLFQGWRDRSARKRHKIRPLGIFGEREQSRYLHVYQQSTINQLPNEIEGEGQATRCKFNLL